MTNQHFIYFADPMCSWCWGFSSVISQIAERFGDDLPIRLVMGGLWPGTVQPMTTAAKDELRGHWRHVTEASGKPFGPSGVDHADFVYDTDPAARAVVLMRRLAPESALPFLEATQAAFYAGGKNVTRPEVLGELAADFGQDADAFAREIPSDTLKAETWRDYAMSQNAGVRGFPTLIVGPRADGAYEPLTRGFQTLDAVLVALAHYLAAATPA